MFVLTVVATALVLRALSRQPASWYRPPDPGDREVIDVADRVENRMLEEVHRIRPAAAPWRLRVRQQHVNAWLAAKLDDWVEMDEHLDWPEALGTPQVRFGEGSMEIAVAVRQGERTGTVSIRVVPTITDQGVRLTVDRIALGRLALPGRPIRRLLDQLTESRALSDVDAARLREWTETASGEPVDLPRFTLSDDRTVHLTDVICTDGAVDLTWRTEGAE